MAQLSDVLTAIKPAAKLLARAGIEARYAATLLHARGPGVASVPPHRMLPVLRALDAYGPVGASLALAVASQPDFPVLIDERGPVSAAELDRTSNELANALLARGFRAGDSIGILARNHRGIFEAIFAGAKVGARTLLLNTDFAKPQLADVCTREEVAVVVHDPEFADVVSGYDPPLGRVLAWTDDDGTDAGATGSDGTETLESVRADADQSVPPRPARKPRHGSAAPRNGGGAGTGGTSPARPNSHAASADARMPSASTWAACRTATVPAPVPGTPSTGANTCSRHAVRRGSSWYSANPAAAARHPAQLLSARSCTTNCSGSIGAVTHAG